MTRRRRAGRTTLAAVLLAALAGCRTTAAPVGGPVDAASRPPAAVATAPVQNRTTPPPPAPDAPVADPVRVVVPAIGVDAPLGPVRLRGDGSMGLPDAGRAAWYAEGPRPGEPGAAILLAHVTWDGAPDVFHRLHELVPGDAVTVVAGDGTRRTWRVTGSERTRKEALPADRIWVGTQEPLLRLVTCAGEFDRRTGGYPDNLVVYAVPDGAWSANG